MAERLKAKAQAWGGKSKTPVTITNAAGVSTTVQAVIETFPVRKTATKKEMLDGDGDVDGLVITNKITNTSLEFYVSESTIASSVTNNNLVIEVGDKVVFDDATFAEIDDGAHAFIVDEVGKTRKFGDTRMISLTVTEYANDVTAEAAP